MTTVLEVSTASRQYVYVTLRTDTDPTSATVEWAFAAPGAAPTAWVAGSWNGATRQVTGGQYETECRCLIGPGGAAQLERGTWTAWVRVTGALEQPVLDVAQLVVRA